MKLLPFSPGLWLVALSGGADSVALSLLMKQEGINIHALHCNFHLRGEESDRDEQFVHDFCHEHNIPLDVIHFDTRHEAELYKESIEMAARRLRYEWFEQKSKELGANGICVAHHKDDQAETVLLNLIRGTGIRGLRGMQKVRTQGTLKIVRPLLEYTRQDILDYLATNNLPYVTDSTNLEREALRNRIRLDVIPLLKQLNPNVVECIARTADNLELKSDLFERLAPIGFSRTQILDIEKHRNNGDSGCQWHSATHTVTVNRGELIVEEKQQIPTLPMLIVEEVSEALFAKGTAFVDAGTVSLPLTLRPMQPGDRFRPFGMRTGSKLLSDFLTDRKIPLNEKQRQLVAVDQTGAIIWVVGREIDDRYKVTEETRKILKLGLTRNS